MSRLNTTPYPLAVAAIATFCVLAEIHATASPYAAIGERNVFGLQDPPVPVVEEPEKPEEPPPNIKVTGITTIMGIPRALLKVQIPAKPPEPAREESYILVAGGLGQGGIEVLEIDEAYGKAKEIKVKVRHGGKESWLGLEKDTARAAAAPPPGAPAPQVAAAQAAMQKLAAARAAAGGGTQPGTSVMPGMPNRPVRTGQPGAPGYAPGGSAVALGGSAAQTNPRHVVHDNQGLSPEEQVILIEANRLKAFDDFASGAEDTMLPFPPTELTPPELDPSEPAPQDPSDQAFPGLPQ